MSKVLIIEPSSLSWTEDRQAQRRNYRMFMRAGWWMWSLTTMSALQRAMLRRHDLIRDRAARRRKVTQAAAG